MIYINPQKAARPRRARAGAARLKAHAFQALKILPKGIVFSLCTLGRSVFLPHFPALKPGAYWTAIARGNMALFIFFFDLSI